ncbi:MAG: multiheme c-type cytochrome [Desulfatiglans sp.]|jgi:hypothetical protein|nr:multiheme c-type cytochrome [Desulfatiglans sp.]
MTQGFKKVYALKGGYRDWIKAQYPTDSKFVITRKCVECHKDITPNIVADWELSKHSKNMVSCSVCHDAAHMSEDDVDKVQSVKPDRCIKCHQVRGDQFKKGKHALAWKAMKAMPTTHWQPMALVEGMKGCGGCHKVGLKTKDEIGQLKKEGVKFGLASCDNCHTRHLFSVREAKEPQACQTCHMGFDHPQWEMYSTSKHGVRYFLKQTGLLPETTAAPTCQTCHMEGGDHDVISPWGFMALRLPMPEDEKWAEARRIILQSLGVLDMEGKPTPRLDAAKSIDLLRLTEEDWQENRKRMLRTCRKCHSINFARGELEKGDQMIRNVDLLMAQAIEIVAKLYRDGILVKSKEYPYPFPDILSFHDAPTEIEQTLFVTFFKHRMRAFQGVFHANPDYALWYGWSAMRRDMTKIRSLDRQLRERKAQ